MDLLAALPLPPLTMAFLCGMTFLAGLVDSVAGGGGLISLPAFLASGLPSHVAFGCNKFSSSIGTTVSTARYFRSGAMDVATAVLAALGAFAGSALASSVLLYISDDVFRIIVICVLPVAAFVILTRKSDELSSNRSGEIALPRRLVISCVIGFFIGGYDGLVGPGTGTFAIIAFNMALRYDLRCASGNAKVLNLASNYASLVVMLMAGKVNFAIGIPTALFCMAGHTIGAGIALKRGAGIIRPMLIVVLVLLLANLVSQFF